MVHSKNDYDSSIAASQILFGKGTKEQLQSLDENTFNAVFSGVPHFKIDKKIINKGINIFDFLAEETKVFNSKGEIRRLIKDKGLNVNMEKFTDPDSIINNDFLINNKYIVIRQGKKKYSIIITD